MLDWDNLSQETKKLVSYDKTRFDEELGVVQNIRSDYALIIQNIIDRRDNCNSKDAYRNYEFVLDHLEIACMRQIKAFYLS